MHSQETSTATKRGLTLLEVIISIAIATAIAGCFSFAVENFYSSSVEGSGDAASSIFRKARGNAFYGICGSCNSSSSEMQSIHIEQHRITLYQGSVFDSNDSYNEAYDFAAYSIAADFTDMHFLPSSADATFSSASTSGSVIISNQVSTTTVTISRYGVINENN